jgi:hypothetical protein
VRGIKSSELAGKMGGRMKNGAMVVGNLIIRIGRENGWENEEWSYGEEEEEEEKKKKLYMC